jgi:hypothetical protein
MCCEGQRRSMISQPHVETASFTSRKVSSQSEQPAVKTSIFLFPTIPLTSSLLAVSELHPFAATLAERFAREFAKEFSILLCFAAARLHLFAGETAH